MTAHVVFGVRCLLLVVFAVAAVTKLRSRSGFQGFTTTVGRLAGIDRRLAALVGGGVVAAEAVTALTLAFWPLIGHLLAVALLVLFVGTVVRAVRRRVFAECGCFGGHGAVLGYPVLVRNLLLLGCAMPAAALTLGVAPANLGSWPAGLVGIALGIGFVRYYDRLVRVLLTRYARSVGLSPDRPAGASSGGEAR